MDEQYLKELESRKANTEIREGEIPDTAKVWKMPPAAVAALLTDILSMGGIASIKMEAGKNIVVGVYEQLSPGKGKMTTGTSLLSPNAKQYGEEDGTTPPPTPA